jgi:probable HAF family extracellular repeat protein
VASGINDRGQVIGWVYGVGEDTHAFLWERGRMRELGEGVPRAINDRGQVVGSSLPVTYGEHLMLWEHGQRRDLGALDSYGGISPFGINTQSQIVGWAYNTTTASWSNTDPPTLDQIGPPFLWEQGRLYELNTLIPRGSGWDLTDAQAMGINDRGEIVGNAIFQGHQRAFVLRPVNEGTLASLLGRAARRDAPLLP